MAGTNRVNNSLETILTYENRNASQWSAVWSTMHVPGMDNAAGAGGRRGTGRRRLRVGSLVVSALLTMHCRVSASALTGGFFFFMVSLIAAVVLLANPLRHFEVYLGQWSISGPGRAFRIIPMLDGIGIAMCINAIVRAICCCSIAAISTIYVLHSLADAKLPFTYCRDFDLKAYEPELKYITALKKLQGTRFLMEAVDLDEEEENSRSLSTTVGLRHRAWRNASYVRKGKKLQNDMAYTDYPRKIEVCKETYSGQYPAMYRTPAYNFFYVEVAHFRSDLSLLNFNLNLLICVIVIWLFIWVLMIAERMKYGRDLYPRYLTQYSKTTKLIWNNVQTWIVVIPWIWMSVLTITAASNLTSLFKTVRKIFQVSPMDIVASVADALEVALYIHSLSVGTELIHGKGLNHYASGHIDPHLNNENVWHSSNMLLLTGLHSGGAALCALVDYVQPNTTGIYNMYESTLWVIPMYSKCTSMGGYSHFASTLIFGGLTFSYIATAFLLLKTALHTIFEYRVKLVYQGAVLITKFGSAFVFVQNFLELLYLRQSLAFVEQAVVGGLILTCMGLSLFIATNGGLALLESVDALMSGVAMPFVCALELTGLMYMYGSHDFMSDINVATEDNMCSTRISTQWQIIPAITMVTLLMKITVLVNAELPARLVYLALAPLLAVLVAVPLRACHNAYTFLRPAPRRGT